MTRPFHLHFHVPDVSTAERALAAVGLPLNARYGAVDGESVRLAPDDPTPDGFRFRLQDHQAGVVNVTLTHGPGPRFDHLGVVTDGFDAVLNRARDADWGVLPNDRRTFLVTPWGFRVEVHPTGGRVDSGLGDPATARIETCELRAPDADAVRRGLDRVLGAVPWLDVREAGPDAERVHVPTVALAGDAFDGPATLRAAALVEG